MSTFDRIEDTETTLAAPGNEMSQWTVDDIRKSDILVFRDSQSQYVDSVVAPNGLQVGLIDEDFLTDLLVTGHITGSGIIYSELGFSGSLQTLVDGTDYLIGEGGITITNNDNGSITISGGGAGGSAGSRTKTVFNIAKDNGVAYPTNGVFFADYSYSPHLIDVYVNGELQTSGSSGDNTVDFWLGNDTATGGVIYFNFGTTVSDDVVVVVGNVGSGGGGGGSTYNAGTGLSLAGSVFNVDTDSATITTNASDQLTVVKVPNSINVGNGLQGQSFDGSSSSTISVKAVSGSPVTISGAGVDFSMSPLSAISLTNTDELMVSQGGALGKVTMADIITAAGGNPGVTNAAYLVAQSSGALSNERVLSGGNGIQVSDDPSGGSFEVSVLLEAGGGLQIVSGKLAVSVADFTGFGLTESGGQLSVNSSAFAGVGLVANGNQLDVDFGPGPNQVAMGSNTITVNAGDGLNLGGTATIGDANSTISLAVQTEDISGLGTSVSNNNLDLYLQGTGGISISTGATDSSGFTPLVIDGAGLQSNSNITQVTAGSGLSGGGTTGNVTVDVDYDDATNIITEAYDGTGITIDTDNDRIMLYDASDTQVRYVKPSQILDEAGAGIIGDPEDGTWDDGEGLWNDFTNNTPTGYAIDRINEFLKGLAPEEAGTLSTITTSTGGGVSVALSFGTNNTIGSMSNVATLDNFNALDVNGNYSVTTNTDIRLGAFGTVPVVQGPVNGGASGDGSNYPAEAFGKGSVGSLVLEVNSADVATIDLSDNSIGAGVSGSGTGDYLTNNTGFYNVSAATSGKFPNGDNFDQFKHRTASWRVGTAIQNEGWNYAKVKHVIGATQYVTNHIQWVNDSIGAATQISIANNAISNLSLTGTKYLSGVNYYTGGTLDYACDVSEFFTNVYGSTNMVVSSSQTQNVSVSPGTIDTGNGEDENKVIDVDENLTITSNKLLNQSVTVGLNVTHPLKNSVSGGGSTSVNNILLYNIAESNNSTLKTSENFNGESFRLIDGAYNNQTDVTDASNVYDSTVSLVGNDALQVWNQRLVWPNQSTNGGDFASISNGPAGNVDYSGITTGERTYYRKLTNPGSSQSNFDLTIQGSGTITNAAGPSGNDIKVFIKLPQSAVTGDSTGWLDISKDFATNQYADGDGCLLGAFDSSLNATNRLTIGVNSVGNEESIIIKIVAASTWSGHISNLSISWG